MIGGDFNFFEIFLRTTITFLVFLLMARLMGKKQLNELTFLHYTTGITLGSIAAEIASKTHISFWNGITSLLWWSILTIIISYIGLKSAKARVIIEGQPVVIIKQGKILEDELRKLRLNMDDLSMLLRERNVFSTADVENAIFEPNGKLSIMLKRKKQPVTKEEQGIFTVRPRYIPMELIVDGNIVEKNLLEAGVSAEWLRNQLANSNVEMKDTFYVELQEDGSLYIDKRKDGI
jgi:uncharacterized membrane protein YcaP (DUF421 family)